MSNININTSEPENISSEGYLTRNLTPSSVSFNLNDPPWQFNLNIIDLSLSLLNKNATDKNIYKYLHYKLLQSYPEHIHIYTDASKIELKSGLAVISKDINIQLKTNNVAFLL